MKQKQKQIKSKTQDPMAQFHMNLTSSEPRHRSSGRSLQRIE